MQLIVWPERIEHCRVAFSRFQKMDAFGCWDAHYEKILQPSIPHDSLHPSAGITQCGQSEHPIPHGGYKDIQQTRNAEKEKYAAERF